MCLRLSVSLMFEDRGFVYFSLPIPTSLSPHSETEVSQASHIHLKRLQIAVRAEYKNLLPPRHSWPQCEKYRLATEILQFASKPVSRIFCLSP
jgi:hypothetical protein